MKNVVFGKDMSDQLKLSKKELFEFLDSNPSFDVVGLVFLFPLMNESQLWDWYEEWQQIED